MDYGPLTIDQLLIANRGEIASRIIRTCRKMGIQSIAVFSEADRSALFVEEADLAINIGGNAPAESYLSKEKIIEAAKHCGAKAIHPGYGFLSEDASFARLCQEAGLIFIGPNPEAIEVMGTKSRAKTLMEKHGVPTIPGYQGSDQRPEKLIQEAKKIGFPVLLKASAGGGGKGMRVVNSEKNLEKAIEAARREALAAFGNEELIIEKYIASGRHIEFQIFGDQHGNTVHLFERECTIQRRYQKVVEESPSPVMTDALRQKMASAALKAAGALNYDNAGTVEFILDEQNQSFYFLEVNTRLQVEHPVTEEITGLDLVQMQIESAQGLPLRIKQEDIQTNGYAFECRLYAEDPVNDFLPVAGEVFHFEWPEVEGLRMETSVRSGSSVSVFYDPMIAKIIMWAESRAIAHQKMQYVLKNLTCLGLTTNQDFLLALLENPDFQKGVYDTHFIETRMNLKQLAKKEEQYLNLAAIAATLCDWKERESSRTLLRSVPSGWRNNFYDFQQEKYMFGEQEILVKYRFQKGSFLFLVGESKVQARIIDSGSRYLRVELNGVQYRFDLVKAGRKFFLHNPVISSITLHHKERFPEKETETAGGLYIAPMPSQIIKVLVKPGQKVRAGEELLVLSSMKMENTMVASEDGVVEEIHAMEGTNVEAGFLLLQIKEADQPIKNK